MVKRLIGWWVLAAGLVLAGAAVAAERHSVILADGTELDYALALPDGFDPNATYPALLALPGGEMTIDGAVRFVERFWQAEAAKRGYLVFGPAALWGGERPFIGQFADDTLLPQFIDRMLAQYHVAEERFDLVGFSAGAEAAFRTAMLHPGLYRSVTVLSGWAEDAATVERLARLRGLPVAMYGGELDAYVTPYMQENRDMLVAAGVEVYFEVVPGAYHRLESLRTPEGQARLFDRISAGRPTGP